MKIGIDLAINSPVKGKLADVTLVCLDGDLNGLTIRGVWIKEKNGRRYVIFPSRKYENRKGETDYYDFFIVTNQGGKAMDELKNSILEAYAVAADAAGIT